jgi:hypothetical protein
MSRLEIILIAISTLSILLNILVVLYARASITRLLFVSEELGDLQMMTNSFSNHLQSVYELDSFYGDQTLSSLLQHAVSFNEQLETFEFIYSITEEDTNNDTTENTPPPPESEAQQE